MHSRELDPKAITPLILVTIVLAFGVAFSFFGLPDPRVALLLPLMLVGGIVLFHRPELGVSLLLFLIYINLSFIVVSVHGGPSIMKFMIPGMFLIALFLPLIKREGLPSMSPLLPLLVLYGLLIVASLFYARDFGLTLAGFEAYYKDGIMALTILLLVRTKTSLRLVIWSLIGAGIFLGSISVFQQVTGTFDNMYWGFAQSSVEHIVGSTNNFRIGGPITTNFYAMIMLALVPLALDRMLSERSPLLKGIAFYAAMVTLMTVIFTFSRGGLVGLAAALLAWGLFRRVSVRLYLVGGLFCLLLLPALPRDYLSRIFTLTEIFTTLPNEGADLWRFQDISMRGRVSEQIAGWRMFRDHPLLGVGYDNYDVYYLEYSEEIGLDSRREQRQAHNLYLEVLAETGLVGIALFLTLIFALFYGLWRAKHLFRLVEDTEMVMLVGGLQAGIIGFLTSSIFLHAAYPRYFWLLVGVAFAVRNVAEMTAAQPEGSHA